MRLGGARKILPFVRALCVATSLPTIALAGSLQDGIKLYNQKKYSEAEGMLEPLASAQPPNAKACYYLGMALEELDSAGSLESARTWLDKAVRLEPENEVYLAEYAGVCLLLADRKNSFALAMEGKRAMTEAIEENPGDLDAREGLMTFYAQAPWPLGSAEKALFQASEIARRDPKWGARAYLKIAAIFRKSGSADKAQLATLEAQKLAPAPAQ